MRLLIATVFLTSLAAQAQPSIAGVANAVSFQPTFAPGSLAVIYGKNFTTAATVNVAGKTAYLQPNSVFPTQMNVQLPTDAPVGATTITVTIGGQTSNAFPLTIAAYAPAIVSLNGTGSGVASVVDAVKTSMQITTTTPAAPTETLTTFATGLGATNPPIATGAGGTAQTAAAVAMTLGTEPLTVLFAGQISPGVYQINFQLPKDVTGCNTTLTLSIGTGSSAATSPPMTLPIGTPVPAICAVENSATGAVRDAAHDAAANSFISIYAASLKVPDSTGSLFPNTSYQGIQVFFDTTPLPLYAVLPSVNLINTVLPSNAGSTGGGTLTIKTASGTSSNYVINLAPADLGVFRIGNSTYPNQAVALLLNSYWFAMPASVAQTYSLPTSCSGLSAATPCGQPVHANDEIVIYFTGGGLATPNADPNGQPVATGQVAPANGSVIYQTVITPTVTIGGYPAKVLFSGIAPGTAAEYQINVVVPTGISSSNNVPVVISFGSSSDTTTIAVSNP
jgi:uncharacterized protein (TIGR03437 family)